MSRPGRPVTALHAMTLLDPPRAKSTILEALAHTEGNRAEAARELRVGRRTLFAYIRKLDLWADIDALHERNGWPPAAGAERKA